MPRDGSGVYTLPAGNPVVTNTTITSSWANTTMSDIAAQLNNVLTRDGLLGPTGPFKLQDGTVAAPGLAFASEPGLGMFRKAAQVIGWAAAGLQVVNFDFSTPGFTGIGLNPRVNGITGFYLNNTPLGAANFNSVGLTVNADGSGALTSSGTGTATPKTITYSALSHTFINGVALQPSANPGWAVLALNKLGAGQRSTIYGQKDGVLRWEMALGDTTAESGTAVGSDFAIYRYDNAGAYVGIGMLITRATGAINFPGSMTVSSIELGPSAAAGPGPAVLDWHVGDATDYQFRMVVVNGSSQIMVMQAPAGNPQLRIEGNTAGWMGTNISGGQLNPIAWAWTTGSQIGIRVDSSQIGTLNITGPSDLRLKKDIVPLVPGLDAVLSVQPIEFEFDHDKREHLPIGRKYGFPGQDIEKVAPLAVSYLGDELHLDLTALVPILWNAVRILHGRISVLEAA